MEKDAMNNLTTALPMTNERELEKPIEKDTGHKNGANYLPSKEKEDTGKDVVEMKDDSTKDEFEGEKMPIETATESKKTYSQKLNMLARKRIASQVPASYSSDEDELELLTTKLNQSSVKINQLEADYESALRERDEIHGELELAEHKIAETRELLHKTEDVNFETQDRVEALTSELRKYKANTKSTTKQIALLEATLEEERLKAVELKKDLARAQKRSDEVQKKAECDKREFEKKDKTIDELKASVEEYHVKTESLLDDISKLKEQIEKSEQQKKELEQRVSAAEKKAHDAAVDSAQIAEENQKLSLEIEAFYVRLSEMQASYNESINERTDFECLAMALQQKVTKLQADLVEAKWTRMKSMSTAVALQNMSCIERMALFLRSKFVSAFHGVFSF